MKNKKGENMRAADGSTEIDHKVNRFLLTSVCLLFICSIPGYFLLQLYDSKHSGTGAWFIALMDVSIIFGIKTCIDFERELDKMDEEYYSVHGWMLREIEKNSKGVLMIADDD
jgi:hypothetical protein